MDKQRIIEQTAAFVQQKLSGEGSGHDWWHVYRVWQAAKHIGKEENADMFVVELAALLHDIADHKFHGGDLQAGPKAARAWLEGLHVDENAIGHVCDIVGTSSFKGADVPSPMKTKEGMVVQDADRLDAIGAIGIARTFAYGGAKGFPMHDPNMKPTMHATFESYSKAATPTINHFYEKLLLLKDLMNTKTAKLMAQERHAFMEEYLKQFYKEWEGES